VDQFCARHVWEWLLRGHRDGSTFHGCRPVLSVQILGAAQHVGSRGVALGIHYLGRVRGQKKALFSIFIGDHSKDIAQFRQRCFSCIHQRVTAGVGRNLSDLRTVLLPVKYSLVVFYFHVRLKELYARTNRRQDEPKLVREDDAYCGLPLLSLVVDAHDVTAQLHLLHSVHAWRLHDYLQL
jgi:hypothetical protein